MDRKRKERDVSMEPVRLIIDNDAGVLNPGKTKQALTVVDGNVPVKQGLRNMRVLVAALGLKGDERPKIYAGAEGPLIQYPGVSPFRWTGHGEDGFGDATASYEKEHAAELKDIVIEKEHAAQYLVRRAKEGKDANAPISILAIGPLTNIAMAIRLDPDFLHNVKDIMIMGGSLLAKGNAGLAAEFNFHCDPEAAHICFTKSSEMRLKVPKLAVVAWEMCVEYALSWDVFDEITHNTSNAYGRLLKKINAATEKLFRFRADIAKKEFALLNPENDEFHTHSLPTSKSASRPQSPTTAAAAHADTMPPQYQVGPHPESNNFMPCDAFAAICGLWPTVARIQDWTVDIELNGTLSRGSMLIDWYDIRGRGQKGEHNVRLITGMKRQDVERIIRDTFTKPHT